MHVSDDLRFALRFFRHRPAFAAAALLTLALSIGAATAVFSLVHGVVLRPLDLPHPERLLMLYEDRSSTGGLAQEVTNVATVRDWRRQLQGRVAVAGSWNNPDRQVAISTGTGAEAVVGLQVSAGYFDVLGAPPAQGRGFVLDEEVVGRDAVAVIGYELWQRQYGGQPGVIGRAVRIDGVPHTIVGVMPRGFRDPLAPRAALWTPLSLPAGEEDRGGAYIRAVGRLQGGTTAAQAQAQLAAVIHGLATRFPEDYRGAGASVAPLQQVVVGNLRQPGFVLFGAVLLVLLIACVNLANLLLARAADRDGEMAVRTAMGAGRGRLRTQLLTESLLLAGVGGALGVGAGAALLRLLVRLAPPGTPRLEEVAIDGPVLLFALLATAAVGLVFGLLPAARAARVEPAGTLRQGGRGIVRDRTSAVRRGLIVAEVGISLALLVGAGLLVRTLLALGSVDPGFEPRGLLAAQVVLPDARYAEKADAVRVVGRLEEQLRALPGVRDVATTSALPLTDYFTDVGVRVEGVERENPPSVQYSSVTPRFFATFGLPLRSGRAFLPGDDDPAPRVIIVNQAFVTRVLGPGEPLGRRVKLGRAPDAPWRTVVGVVGDVHHGGLDVVPEPQMYLPEAQTGQQALQLLLRVDGDPASLGAAVRAAVAEVDRDLPVQVLRTGETLLTGQLALRRFVGVLLGGFALVAVLLALVGIYGVMAFLVAQRRRELGVRLALGARPREVLELVLRETAALAAIGVGVGAALAVLLSRGLQSLLYGVRSADPITFVAAVLVMFVVALAAAAEPARRAAGLDPVRALSEE
ncbi:MAG TPA: ADOP family duplicated permease [Thermoanaerobaculia bacterium]|jgi:putative ABC transport system permease protein|nr:ADOP family duplicated permease [Thermoanaerobaculia bacterium]